MQLRDQIIIEKNKKHYIDVLVDEIFVSEFEHGQESSSIMPASDCRKLSRALFKRQMG